MRQYLRRSLRAVAALAAVAGCAVALPVGPSAGVTGTPEPAGAASAVPGGRLLEHEPVTRLDPALRAVAGSAERVVYGSRALDGRPVRVSGVVLTPRGKAPRGGWPVVSWAHGATGIDDRCAPSLARNARGDIDLYGYAPFLADFLKDGYAVAATDYEGLGTEGEHPYIVADSEGRGIIDAVRAARQLDSRVSRSWFAVGHSQGGQGAIAAGELAPVWGRGLDYRGTVGIAPVTDVGSVYGYGTPSRVDRGVYLYALHGLRTVHPGLRFDRYLGDRALELLPKARNGCSAEVGAYFSGDLGPSLGDHQFAPQAADPQAALRLAGWLDEQSVPRRPAPGPMLLLQGDQDTSIKQRVTRQATWNAQRLGTRAAFRLYPGRDHLSVLAGDPAEDVRAWLDAHRPGRSRGGR